MIDLGYLEKRKAELQQGLEQLKENYKQAIYAQQGAIALIDEQIEELVNPKKEAAETKRKAKAARRAAITAAQNQPEAPSVNGKETPVGERAS